MALLVELTTSARLRPLITNMHFSNSVSADCTFLAERANQDCDGSEKAINKKKRDFRDVNAAENINKLNQELLEVNKIMTESFEMLVNREKNLGQITEKSSKIRDGSRNFRKEAKKLKMAFWFRKYTTPIVLALIVIFLIFVKFFVFG